MKPTALNIEKLIGKIEHEKEDKQKVKSSLTVANRKIEHLKKDSKQKIMELRKQISGLKKGPTKKELEINKTFLERQREEWFNKGKSAGCRIGYQRAKKDHSPKPGWVKIPKIPYYMNKNGLIFNDDFDYTPVKLSPAGENDPCFVLKHKKKSYFVHEIAAFLFAGPRPIGYYPGHKYHTETTNIVRDGHLGYLEKTGGKV